MNRQRADKALEVYLKDEDVLVGWLTDFDGSTVRENIKVSARDATSERSKFFKLERRHCEFDGFTLARKGPEATKHLIASQVPGYAEETRHFNRDAIGFNWLALKVDLDDYEWIFGLPQFEPCDCNEPDLEARTFPTFSIPGDLIYEGTLTASKLKVGSLAGMEAASAWLDEASEVPADLYAHATDALTYALDSSMRGLASPRKASDSIASSTTSTPETTLTAAKLDEIYRMVAPPKKPSAWDYIPAGYHSDLGLDLGRRSPLGASLLSSMIKLTGV